MLAYHLSLASPVSLTIVSFKSDDVYVSYLITVFLIHLLGYRIILEFFLCHSPTIIDFRNRSYTAGMVLEEYSI